MMVEPRTDSLDMTEAGSFAKPYSKSSAVKAEETSCILRPRCLMDHCLPVGHKLVRHSFTILEGCIQPRYDSSGRSMSDHT